MREKVVGHDFRKRKLLTQTHHIQNFASQSGPRPPHHGQSILLRKTVCDRPVFFGVHTLRFTGQSILLRKTVYCQNFATQNRLFRTLLRKAVFDHRIMVKAFCYAKRSATAPFSSGCILVRSVFVILRVSYLTNKKIATMVMTFAKQKWLCHRTVLCGQ